MNVLLNLIFISVIICYFLLKQNYISLSICLSFLIIFAIYNKDSFFSCLKNNVKFNKFIYLDFLPISIFAIILYWSLGDDYIYTSQDAFSTWGQHIKWIYQNNKMWDIESDLIYKKNIPGVPIYEYIFVSIFGFSEKNITLSLHFLTLLTLSVAAKKLLKNKFDYLLLTPIIFIIPPLFGYAFVDIMVDGLLASIITLYTIMVFLFLNQKEKYFNLILISIFLIMIKPTSIWYLIFIPAFLSLSFLFFNKFYKKKIQFLQIFYITLLVLPALYVWYDWNIYVELIESNRVPKFKISEYLSLEFNNKAIKVIIGFHNWAMKGNFLLLKIVELPYYTSHFLLNLITIIFLKKQFDIKKVILILFMINFFIIFNLLTYLFLIVLHFGNYEAENVASIGRYLGVIYITWSTISIILFYYIIIKVFFKSRKKIKIMTFLTFWIMSVGILIFTQNYYLKLGPSKDAIIDFKKLKLKFDLIKKSKNTKIYFISQGNFGHEASLFFYMLSPFTKSHWCWSLTNQVIKGKIMHWDCKGSLISYLNGYTHVYIDKLDDIFINEQKSYFENNKIEEKRLYLINHNYNNTKTYLTLE